MLCEGFPKVIQACHDCAEIIPSLCQKVFPKNKESYKWNLDQIFIFVFPKESSIATDGTNSAISIQFVEQKPRTASVIWPYLMLDLVFFVLVCIGDSVCFGTDKYLVNSSRIANPLFMLRKEKYWMVLNEQREPFVPLKSIPRKFMVTTCFKLSYKQHSKNYTLLWLI